MKRIAELTNKQSLINEVKQEMISGKGNSLEKKQEAYQKEAFLHGHNSM